MGTARRADRRGSGRGTGMVGGRGGGSSWEKGTSVGVAESQTFAPLLPESDLTCICVLLCCRSQAVTLKIVLRDWRKSRATQCKPRGARVGKTCSTGTS
eukprot:7232768-Pyramimonas_sp.AAC.1